MKIFAERLLELRQEAKISQAQLAKAIDVSFSVVCYWETDRSEPTIVNLLKLAKYFDVSADYLIGLSDD
ncbi:MAG: helix-turn-helix domain-containing protein [Clostridiales bacterium]|jgi:transcriptional regulator with XRE-family HTH domain|nr:helix-turn-helix domain-containing protein [Clostridiales bacterium]